MGDIADDMVAQMIERGMWGRTHAEPPPPRCKHCGATDVRWRQQTGGWVLFSFKPGVVHECKVSPNVFDNLDQA